MSDLDSEQIILVPCDYSALAFNALSYGVYMSKLMNCKVVALNVAAKQSEMAAMTKKMNFLAEECASDLGVKPNIMVRQGNPQTVIKEVAEELNPALLVLKTNGGMATINNLAKTKSPFLVVHGPPPVEEVKTITFPINFTRQHDQKLQRVVQFHQYYPQVTTHIITPSGKGTDKEKIIATNVRLIGNVLKEKSIKNQFITHDYKYNDADTILKLAKGTDLIIIQIENRPLIKKLFFGLREKKLIRSAEKIPVLCFNKQKQG